MLGQSARDPIRPEASPVYRPRNPQNSAYYRHVEDHFETFGQVYEERFEKRYGLFRPYVQPVIYQYLDCGDLHNGFARIRCKQCGYEYLLAFSCKRRYFCPKGKSPRIWSACLCRAGIQVFMFSAAQVHIRLDYSDSQIPSFDNDVHKDPDYPIKTYVS